MEGYCDTFDSIYNEIVTSNTLALHDGSTTDMFSTLIVHGMILDRGIWNKPTSESSKNTALAVKTVDPYTNPNCKAKKWSTHSTNNCYWPGRGKEEQFPPNFGQKTWANVVSSTQDTVKHFVLLARIPDTPGNLGIVIRDDEDEIKGTHQ